MYFCSDFQFKINTNHFVRLKNQLLNILLIIAYILLIAGAILWFNAFQWANYIFTLGAFCYAIPKLLSLP